MAKLQQAASLTVKKETSGSALSIHKVDWEQEEIFHTDYPITCPPLILGRL